MLQDTIKENENVQVNSKEMEALKEHFPQCFDASGNFDIAIFEELVKTKDISIKKEGYALNFLGKSYARYLSNLESETVIVPDENNKDNPSENIYIVGDNLDALQHLKHSYAGAIKCIYIDPPYNTGSDGFVYNDKFEFSTKDLAEKIGIEEDEAERVLNMQGKSTHSAWLTFMYPRLELAYELLSDTGLIFISIDDNELVNCKALCDNIFGENNYINTISVFSKVSAGASGGGEDKRLKKNIEYLLMYAKNAGSLGAIPSIYKRTLFSDYLKEMKVENKSFKYTNVLYKIGEKSHYTTIKDGSGENIEIYKVSNYEIKTVKQISKEEGIPEREVYIKYYDKIMTTTNAQTSIRDRVWNATDSENNMYMAVYKPISGKDKGKEKELIFIGKQKVLVIWFKDTAEIIGNEIYKKEKIGTYWDGFSWINVTKEGNVRFDDGKKPIALIQQILKLIASDEDITIVDFFSGSGTTAHAVMQENIEDAGNRKFIMVQLPERIVPNTKEKKEYLEYLKQENIKPIISEIGQERIRRAARKIRQDEPEKSKDVDLGFKTYYLKTPEKQTLDKMESFNPEFPMDRDDILAAFGKDSVLATWEIKDGYGFNTPIKEIDLKGYTAYLVNDGIHGANLYLLDEISEPSIMELVRRLEANELVADKIIVYGYALSYTASTSLRTNLKTLKNRNPIEVAIRY